MPLPSNKYIAWQGVETCFRDKTTGLPLTSGYVKFFSDVEQRVSKEVYQQVQLPDKTYNFVSIGSTVSLTAAGTFGSPSDGTDIQVYAYPFDDDGNIELYSMEVYSSGDVLQFTREGQPANVADNANIDEFESSTNIIENSQFVNTFLPPSLTNIYTITDNPSTIQIAPDWYIVTAGTGTVTVTLEEIADITMPTLAPYAIKLSSTGITSLLLRQVITQSPRILGDSVVSAMLVANSSSDNIPLIMRYTASNGYTVDIMTGETTDNGAYTVLQDDEAVQLNTTNDNTPSTPGYVNIDIVIPAPLATVVGITSVQVVSSTNVASQVSYIQQSVPQQLDHLFHYYNPLLAYKPIPSYLIGWDFPLNPAQSTDADAASLGAIGPNKSAYLWDQTIGFQTVTNTLSVSRDTDTNGIKCAVSSDSSFALIQYLSAAQAREILSQKNAMQIKGAVSSGTLNGTLSIWWTTGATLPDLTSGTNKSLVSSITSGVPTAGNPADGEDWTQVERGGLEADAPFTLTTTHTSFDALQFDASATDGKTTATFIAIVIAFDTLDSANTVTIDYCSLVGGNIATRPAAQTPEDVLSQCELFYEKSYDNGIPPGEETSDGTILREQLALRPSTAVNLYPTAFGYNFRTPKRATPTVDIRTPGTGGADDSVFAMLFGSGGLIASGNVTLSDYWDQRELSTKSQSFIPKNSSVPLTIVNASTEPTGAIEFHYVADARLGLI